EGKPPTAQSVRELMAGRDWLFQDDFAHVDTSHLNAVVQMSTQLEPGPALDLARELCDYGRRISPRLRYPGDPPVENQAGDYAALAEMARDQGDPVHFVAGLIAAGVSK